MQAERHIAPGLLAVPAICCTTTGITQPGDPPVGITLVTDQSDATLGILAKRETGQTVTEDNWRQLFSSEVTRG
jgi:hypothetical protein